MKIYKYRDFSSPSEDDFGRLEDSVHRLLVWCARPDTLNDPQEFVWQCDYTPTAATPALLAGVLVKARGRTNTDAQGIAAAAIQNGRLEVIAKPVFDGMIEQCRDEIGLACFGATPDNPTLWRRYGGDGAGVCIEFDVPADLLGTQLHRVEYPKEKRLHVDQLLRAFVDRNEAQVVYDVALLSKPSSWADEEEIRFVSQRHSILVAIDRAQVPCVFLDDSLGADVRARIERITVQVRLAERGR
jgi:hypothetical protein